MNVLNQTVFDIPLTWNRIRFKTIRHKYRCARKLILNSINVQFEKQLRGLFSHNIEIEENINQINVQLLKYHDKLRVLDNMIELASQSLRIYFDRRMEHVSGIINQHCHIIQEIIREEAEHWKEIHSVLDQNLINPGDIRSRNNYPRTIQKSPASNIQTIEEENDGENDEHASKLIHGKSLTPLLTQMIRKSRLQSKRLTIVPSKTIHIPIEQDISLTRKKQEINMQILPLSTNHPPLEFVDTTFVVKPDDTMIDEEMQNENDDEPNGTYRDPNQRDESQMHNNQNDTSLFYSQPNIPARLCFSPTIIQDPAGTTEDDFKQKVLSFNYDSKQSIIDKANSNNDQFPMKKKKIKKDNHRFGQTFLLDNIKTEQIDDEQYPYKRPTIPDDDIVIIHDTNPSTSSQQLSQMFQTNSNEKDKNHIRERTSKKSRKATTNTKTKSKPVIFSGRKTRSAAKVLAEKDETTTKVLTANKRKTRKRKQSKSEASNDENEQPEINTNPIDKMKRKVKKRKKSKSKSDHNRNQSSSDDNDDNNNHHLLVDHKTLPRKKNKLKRNEQQQETLNDNDKILVNSNVENEKHTNSAKRKKVKISASDNEEKKMDTKKRKGKQKKSERDDDIPTVTTQYRTTRSSSRRNQRSN